MKRKLPVSCLSFWKGSTTRIFNGGRDNTTEGTFCFLQLAGKDQEFLEDALYGFRTQLENAGFFGDFLGIRCVVTQDSMSGFLLPSEWDLSVATLIIYVDRREQAAVKRLYKKWNRSLSDGNCE